MLFKMDLGAEIDVVTGDELKNGVNDIINTLGTDTRVRAMYMSVPATSPVFTPPFTGIVEVGSPPTGRIWNVLGYTITGQDDATQAAAGTAALYIGNRPSHGGATMVSECRQPRISVPSGQAFPQQSVWCLSSQYVFFNLVALTVITQVVCMVHVAEYREEDILQYSGR